METERHSVLAVSKDSKLLAMVQAILAPPAFELFLSSDFNEARRIVSDQKFDIVIVDSGDGYETDFAIDVSDSTSTVLLAVPAEHFDQISYRVEGYGILTITKPFDAFYFYNMIKVAIAVHFKIQMLFSQTVKLKEKMEEIRLVNRAKMLLMQNLSMSEEESHRYIEKESMDRCIKKTVLAQEIIRTYGT